MFYLYFFDKMTENRGKCLATPGPAQRNIFSFCVLSIKLCEILTGWIQFTVM